MKNFFVVFAFLIVTIQNSIPQWSNDPTVNTPVCLAPNGQGDPRIISDGQGGSLTIWQDNRGSNSALYAQRLNSNGIALWDIDGVLVNSVENARYDEYQFVSDGLGGCIVAWENDGSGPDAVFAQRINSNGVRQWALNGVPICTTESFSPELIEDGFGGAVITWEDGRLSGDLNIFAQRINSNGLVQWTPNGISVCSESFNQQRPKIISDASNGAIIVWRDYRSNTNSDIYAQRVNAAGISQWSSDGIPVCVTTSDQTNLSIISDDNSGAIIAWSDYLSSGNYDNIYTQRINSMGALLWGSTGIPIDTSQSRTYDKEIARDGNNGAVFTWVREDANEYKVYAQLINPNGNLLWGINGIPVCIENGNRYSAKIIGDNAGGAIITWSDYRIGGDNADIYAQRIDINGQISWTLNGIAVSIADSQQSGPSIINNESNGAIITWTDQRNGWDNPDIYSQKINSDGSLGGTSSVNGEALGLDNFALFQNYPNPFNPTTKIKYSIPNSGIVQIKVFDILGNELETLFNEYKQSGSYYIEFNASRLSSGVYFYRMISGSYLETKNMILIR